MIRYGQPATHRRSAPRCPGILTLRHPLLASGCVAAELIPASPDSQYLIPISFFLYLILGHVHAPGFPASYSHYRVPGFGLVADSQCGWTWRGNISDLARRSSAPLTHQWPGRIFNAYPIPLLAYGCAAG